MVFAQALLIKAAVVSGTWKMAVCFSGMEDCMLPSPVIQDSGSTVTIRAAVCLDSGPETLRCVWVSELVYFVHICDYTQILFYDVYQ